MKEVALLEFFLPEGILEYFEISGYDKGEEEIKIYLEERNVAPEEYVKEKLESKGFYDEIKVQDFPIRDKAAYLFIKRRKWINLETGAIVCRDWNMVAKGTRMTREFASFLKEIARYQANKR